MTAAQRGVAEVALTSGRVWVVDLRGVVQRVLDELLPQHPEREVTSVSAGEMHGDWDLDRLAQALTNLVSNALNHGATGGAVSVRTSAEPEWVTISVHNFGAPIAPQVLPVVFEPLRRGTAQMGKSGRSVGLGLYIVKHIVEAHGGSVSVRSTAEDGTTFAMRLPRRA